MEILLHMHSSTPMPAMAMMNASRCIYSSGLPPLGRKNSDLRHRLLSPAQFAYKNTPTLQSLLCKVQVVLRHVVPYKTNTNRIWFSSQLLQQISSTASTAKPPTASTATTQFHTFNFRFFPEKTQTNKLLSINHLTKPPKPTPK